MARCAVCHGMKWDPNNSQQPTSKEYFTAVQTLLPHQMDRRTDPLCRCNWAANTVGGKTWDTILQRYCGKTTNSTAGAKDFWTSLRTLQHHHAAPQFFIGISKTDKSSVKCSTDRTDTTYNWFPDVPLTLAHIQAIDIELAPKMRKWSPRYRPYHKRPEGHPAPPVHPQPPPPPPPPTQMATAGVAMHHHSAYGFPPHHLPSLQQQMYLPIQDQVPHSHTGLEDLMIFHAAPLPPPPPQWNANAQEETLMWLTSFPQYDPDPPFWHPLT
mmetsp:Transcript_123729/g.174395  ORF Transcript_123729/g.174395 Transcript_123729/m.174395 type:complete len:269 (-) Transcript_123729:83-889(-)